MIAFQKRSEQIEKALASESQTIQSALQRGQEGINLLSSLLANQHAALAEHNFEFDSI